jgi:hypothetical protein
VLVSGVRVHQLLVGVHGHKCVHVDAHGCARMPPRARQH